MSDNFYLIPHGPGAVLEGDPNNSDWEASEVAVQVEYLNAAPGATRAQITFWAKSFRDDDEDVAVSVELTKGDVMRVRASMDDILAAIREDEA